MKYKIIAVALILLISALLVSTNNSVTETSEPITKPPIVDHFACGDYCPGDQSQYMKKIYEGVKDEDECKKIGGTPYKYIGFVEVNICLAE